MNIEKILILLIILFTVSLGFTRLAHSGTYTQKTLESYLSPLKKMHTSETQAKGLHIYTQQYLLDEGWRSMETMMTMELIDARGRRSTRKVIKQTLEEDAEPDKTLGIFVEPNDIKGTAMLTFEQQAGADRQWLYMPVIKRVKKINAQNKSGSFVGSEFSWEDISTTELSKYRYQYLSQDETHWRIEKVPVYDHSGYSRQVTWVDKSNYQTDKIEYYDRKGDLLKTQIMSDWQVYQNRYWRPLTQHMTNHQNNKQTILKLSDYVLGDVNKQAFTSLNLRRSISQIR